MFTEGGIEAKTARVSERLSAPGVSSFSVASIPDSSPASIHASRVVLPLLLAEAAAFALAAASGKIPAFLFTAVRALLTF
jgi:hypothetical protein